MKLIVISPESDDSREAVLLAELFAEGLTDYHLRKPHWSREQMAAFITALAPILRRRLVLHSHHDLAADFDLAGVHFPEALAEKCNHNGYKFRSRAVHDLTTLEASLFNYNRLLLSPVFPSISKPGHTPPADFDHTRLNHLLTAPRFAEVIALGGIDDARIPECKALGFDGVAVLGAVWQAADSVTAFRFLREIASFA